MERESLGLIETLGMVGAIEAADAGAKAAKVTFHGYARGRAGLITVMFTGDVAAVRAAVAAGVAAAKRVGQVVSVDVIARPDRQLHVTPDGSKPIEHEISAALETAMPYERREILPSEGVVRIPEQPEPEDSAAVAKPLPQVSDIAIATVERSAVAVSVAEESIATIVEQPAADWTEAVPRGGNGDLPTAEAAPSVDAAKTEAVPPTHTREKVRKTKAQKKP